MCKGGEQVKRKKVINARDPDRFLSGVFVLSVSTVIVKIIGLAYKIPMIAKLGAQGMGYFNSAAEIYAVLCVISTAGLPVALSMLVSANRESGKYFAIQRIDRAATALFLSLGATGTAVMLVFAKPIAQSIGNIDAYLCILAIAPALFFVCFSSAVRGYFQGFQNMLPTAISQLIEAIGKLLFGVWFASVAIDFGLSLPTVAAFAVLGLSLGTFLSALYLLLCKTFSRRRWRRELLVLDTQDFFQEKEKSGYFSMLLKIAIPITVSSSVLSLTRLSDMALMMRRLQRIGVSVMEANVLYGAYTTLAVPVFSLIPSLITPIALACVPQLSGAIEAGSRGGQIKVVAQSLRLTMLFSIPAAMGISVYAEPILSLLFSGEQEAVAISSPLLAILGLSIPFAGLITTTNALLHSYRQTVKPILSMSIGAIVKIVSAYFLLGNPRIGVYGAPLSTLLCNWIVTGMNFAFLNRCVPCMGRREYAVQTYWKPLGASALAILASLAAYLPMRNMFEQSIFPFLCATCVAIVVYGALLILMGGLTKEDWMLLPMGNRIQQKIENCKNKRIQIKDG